MKSKKIILVLILIICPATINAEGNCSPDIPNPPLDGQIKITEIKPENTGDDNGWVGIKNASSECIDLAGWVLYDGEMEHELFITRENTEGFFSDSLIAPGAEAKVLQKSDKDFTLNGNGGRVELYSGPAEMLGVLQDKAIYPRINSGESYRIIDRQGPDAGSSRVEYEEREYRIPEDSGQWSVISDNINTNSQTPSSLSTGQAGAEGGRSSSVGETEKAGFSSLHPRGSGPAFGGTEEVEEEINNNATRQSSNDPAPLLASSGLEKSPWRWFYWLWGSWFLWRILLPFLALWAALFTAVYYIRKRYLS